jgi:hypothetical protein
VRKRFLTPFPSATTEWTRGYTLIVDLSKMK